MNQNLEKTKKSEEEKKIYDYAFETREFIEGLYTELFNLGVFKKENDSLERSLKVYGILIDHLTEFEIDPENEYLGSVYDDYSKIMQLLFKGLREEGLTLKNDLVNYDENVYAVARKFGEVNERLRKLQEMFEERESKQKQAEKVVQKSENDQIRELQVTINKHKWAIIAVVFLGISLSVVHLHLSSKEKSKLESEKAALQRKLNNTERDSAHYKSLFEMCTKSDKDIKGLFSKLLKSAETKNSTEIDGPVIKPQD